MKISGIIFLLIGLGSLSADEFDAQKYRMDGKYGLHAKLNDHNWEIYWMTAVQEEGSVFSISKGEQNKMGSTPKSTIHRFELPLETGTREIKFGGKESGFDQLSLQKDFDQADFLVEGADSIYVFGDTHGNYNYVRDILIGQKLINEQLEWIGGNSHLVFVGDILDRGDDALRLAWFIYDLERSAKKMGGAVHLVLGNHEIMVMSNDVRYVSAKEEQIASLYGIEYAELFHPTETLIGRWLASKPAVLKIDDVIFAHGGLILDQKISEINDQTYRYLKKPAFTEIRNKQPDLEKWNEQELTEIKDFFYNSYSPFWYRGYVQTDSTGAYLDFILNKNKAKLHVVGHTSRPNIEERFRGKLIASNVHEAGSEMLLLVRKKKKYLRFRIDLNGKIEEL